MTFCVDFPAIVGAACAEPQNGSNKNREAKQDRAKSRMRNVIQGREANFTARQESYWIKLPLLPISNLALMSDRENKYLIRLSVESIQGNIPRPTA